MTAHPLTVGQYLDDWMADYVRPRCAASTVLLYARDVRRIWQPTIGHIPLEELTAAHLQAVIDLLGTERGLAPGTIRTTAWRLGSALRLAHANRLIAHDPVRRVRLPRRPATGITTLTQDELCRLVDHALAARYWYSRMVGTLALSGMRHGEARALTEDDIMLEGASRDGSVGVLRVERQIPVSARGWDASPPKSASGERSIPIAPALADLLTAQVEAVARQARRRGTRGWAGSGLLFPSTNGRAANPRGVLDTMRQIRRDAGIASDITANILRHTYASVLVDAGLQPAQLKEFMGHAHVSITLDVYYSATPVAKRAAADALTKALGG